MTASNKTGIMDVGIQINLFLNSKVQYGMNINR